MNLVRASASAPLPTVAESDHKPVADAVFATTRWSVVLRASRPDSPEALAA